MTPNPAWPVEIAPVGPVAVGTMLWRHRGQLRFTVIVKATFGFAPGGVMAPIQAAPIQRTEVHFGGNPMRSILAASDLSPFLDRADVLFVGHAHAPRGAPAAALPVRLSILRDQWALLDKSLLVLGDRAPARAGQPQPEPAPFQHMPIVYERAFGGIGASDNPLGVGAGSSQSDAMPNIVRPERGSRDTAGFGPISPFFPSRKRLLKGHPRRLLIGPVAELPDDIERAYFQSSPDDQRTVYLRGDEVIALENLHPSYPRLVTRLPGVRAIARIYTPDAEQHLNLEADTLFIEGDHERASLTFRASHPLTHEHTVSGLYVLAGLELPAQAIAWPGFHERRLAYRPVVVPAAGSESGAGPAQSTQRLGEQTYELNARESADAASLQAPFAVAAPGSSRQGSAEPIPGAPWATRKQQDTLLLIEPDAEPAKEVTADEEEELFVTVEEDEDQITGPFRAKSAPKPEVPAANIVSRRQGPEEDDFDERAATLRMAPVRRPLPQSPISAPLPKAATPPPVPPPRPSAPAASGLPFVPPPRPSAPAAASKPPVPPPRRSSPAAVPPHLSPTATIPPTLPVAAALPFVPAAATPPLVPAAATPPLVSEVETAPLAPAVTTPPVVPPAPAPETGIRAEVLSRLRARAPLQGLDLAAADLHGIDFTGAALARLDLRGARLDHCTFRDAQLAGANLTGADLTEATLTAADLGGADLSRAVLTEARLDRTTLIDARIEDARGEGVVFDGARMSGARVSGAALTGSSFREVDAPSSIWERATLDNSSFQGAKLREASFARAICHRASFAAADMPGANLQNLQADSADFQGASLEGAELRNAHVHEATFDGANLKKARAHKADLSRSRFERADLGDAVLRSAGLAGASFRHARLDGASFIEANLEQASFHGASIKTAKMNGANLKGVIYADTDDPAPDLQRKEQS